MKRNKVLSALVSVISVFCFQRSYGAGPEASVINMVFTSDAHYGITRPKFRGDTNVDRVIRLMQL